MSFNIVKNKYTKAEQTAQHLGQAAEAGLHFDGAVGTYVDCGDTTILDGATKMSIEAIVATSGTTEGNIVAKSQAVHCYRLQFTGAGTIQAVFNNGSATGVATSTGTYNDGNPKHIVTTWDGATVSVYVNGNLDGTVALAGGSIPNTTDKLALGAQLNSSTTNNSNFDGIIYRARLWNKALTAAEVTASFENATVPFAEQWGVQTDAVTNGTFAADTNWSKESGWTISGGKAVCATTSYQALYQTGFTGGKKYRVTYTISDYSSGGIYLDSQGGAAVGVVPTDGTLRTANGTYTEEVIINKNGNLLVFRGQASTTTSLKLDDVSAYRVGAVADYDLAFANPTQSLMVQDRAGAADGTASATGVVQVTPIEQLNSKSARIGTSVATPADGELAVSGKVGVGTGDPQALADLLEIYPDSGSAVEGLQLLIRGGQADLNPAGDSIGIGFGYGNANDYIKSGIISEFTSTTAVSNLHLCTTATAGAATVTKSDARLTIDSAGVVNINGPAQDLARLIVADNAEATRSVLALVSTVTTAAANVKADLVFNVPVTATSATASGLCRIFGAKENALSGNVAGYLSFETRPAAGSLTERMRIDSAGNVGIGVTPTQPFEVATQTLNVGAVVQGSYDTNANSMLTIRKSNGTIASPTAITSGHVAGMIRFDGYDGNSWHTAADIFAPTSGTVADGRVAADLVFRTAPDSVSGVVERMRIDSTGLATFANRLVAGDGMTLTHDVTSGQAFYSGDSINAITLADEATTSVTASPSMILILYVRSGTYIAYGGVWGLSYRGTTTLLYDDGYCAAADTDTKLCVFKSTNSHTTTIKNRLGGEAEVLITMYKV